MRKLCELMQGSSPFQEVANLVRLGAFFRMTLVNKAHSRVHPVSHRGTPAMQLSFGESTSPVSIVIPQSITPLRSLSKQGEEFLYLFLPTEIADEGGHPCSLDTREIREQAVSGQLACIKNIGIFLGLCAADLEPTSANLLWVLRHYPKVKVSKRFENRVEIALRQVLRKSHFFDAEDILLQGDLQTDPTSWIGKLLTTRDPSLVLLAYQMASEQIEQLSGQENLALFSLFFRPYPGYAIRLLHSMEKKKKLFPDQRQEVYATILKGPLPQLEVGDQATLVTLIQKALESCQHTKQKKASRIVCEEDLLRFIGALLRQKQISAARDLFEKGAAKKVISLKGGRELWLRICQVLLNRGQTQKAAVLWSKGDAYWPGRTLSPNEHPFLMKLSTAFYRENDPKAASQGDQYLLRIEPNTLTGNGQRKAY